MASIARKRAASSELLKVPTKKSTSDETSNSTNISISEDTSVKSMSSSEDTEVNTSANGRISCDIVKAARHGVMRETMGMLILRSTGVTIILTRILVSVELIK